MGDITQQTDPAGRQTKTLYDPRRRPTAQTNNANETTRFEYDRNGNRTAQIRPSGARAQYAYDARNVLTDVTDALTHTTHYAYDANLNLTAVTDANTHRVDYAYDPMNRRTSITYPGGASERFTFDAAGNLITHTDANGVTITRGYDALNRERTKTYTGNTDGLQSQATDYDENNNITQLTERIAGAPERITRTAYDEFDRPTSQTDPYGAQVKYTYDPNGNRTGLTTQDARITRYSFDALNRLSTVGGAGGSVGYTYDLSGLITARSYPNGVVGSTSYDPAGRPAVLTYTKSSAILNRTEYAYDPNGNRTLERINRPNGAQRTDYRFDPADRLLGATLTQGGTTTDTAWTYDSVGNRTDETVQTNNGTSTQTATKHYSYDARDQLTQIQQTDPSNTTQTITLSYDPQGNLTQKQSGAQTTTYTWDANDQLASISQNGTQLGKYRNNAFGLRVEKEATDPIHPGAPPQLKYTLWDNDTPIQDSASSGQVIARYEFADREPIGLIHSEDGQQSLHPDGLGSIVLTTDPAGAIHRETLFNAWGVPIVEAGPPANRLGYTGHQMDAESGLIYMQARYYDPETARFLSQDPADGNPDQPASYHRYLYAYANPTVYIDPYGLYSWSEYAQDLWSYNARAIGVVAGLTVTVGKAAASVVLVPASGFGAALDMACDCLPGATRYARGVSEGATALATHPIDSVKNFAQNAGTEIWNGSLEISNGNPFTGGYRMGSAMMEVALVVEGGARLAQASTGMATRVAQRLEAASAARATEGTVSSEAAGAARAQSEVANATDRLTAETPAGPSMGATSPKLTDSVAARPSAELRAANENAVRAAAEPVAPAAQALNEPIFASVGARSVSRDNYIRGNVMDEARIDARMGEGFRQFAARERGLAEERALAAKGGTPLTAAEQLEANRAAGAAFEQQIKGQLQQTQSGVVEQVTVKTQSGVKTRIDLMGRDANGNIVCTECKSSATAPLTKNQTAAFPEIQQSGATVVGQGKPGFPGGTKIPPTKIDIIRP